MGNHLCSWKHDAVERVRQHSEDAAHVGPTGCESKNITVAADPCVFSLRA